ncbi:MAG: J domain-containing protein [Akkermansiaceae bacterium]|nr:J domain-containing protein [Akkermansiaceae bacterium]
MDTGFKDYYATLGVSRDASAAEIKKAFRKLARKYHPDVAKDKKSAEAKFKEINEANEVLSDPEKRQRYDDLGENWQGHGMPPHAQGRNANGTSGQSFNFSGTGFSDFFEQFFSGGEGRGFSNTDPWGANSPPPNTRGNDIQGDILVTLEEVMHGDTRPISLQITNPKTGKAEKHSFHVRIPVGVIHGKRIRVSGQGEPGTGNAGPGDLYLRVRHAAHPFFHTEGSDLFYELNLAPWEAVLGAEVTVPTLDGPIKLRVPARSESDQQLRVRNRGLPKGKGTDRGDFFATITIHLPKESTDEELALWEQLREISSFSPRPTSP